MTDRMQTAGEEGAGRMREGERKEMKRERGNGVKN